MLKMQSKGNLATITEDGRIKFIGTLTEAWSYIDYRKFMALVQGQSIGFKRSKSYYVRSLMPAMKKVVAYTLDEEAV